MKQVEYAISAMYIGVVTDQSARFVGMLAAGIIVLFTGCDSRLTSVVVDATSEAPDGASRSYTCIVGERCEIEVSDEYCTWEFDPPWSHLTRKTASYGDGRIRISFTPRGSDLGQHEMTISCLTDGGEYREQPQPITVTVRAPTGPARGPVFVRPIGPGQAYHVDQDPCIDMKVRVEDVDSLDVEIRQDPPLAGSALQPMGHQEAVFHWCPDEAQRATARHVLYLVADDGDHPPVIINDGAGFYLLLRRD